MKAQPCDHPMDIAVLRLLMAEPDKAHRATAVADALDWLEGIPQSDLKSLPASLKRLQQAGLVVQELRPPYQPLYRFKTGSSVRQATGGIDPLSVTLEELLEAFSWRQGRRPKYDPKAWKRDTSGKPETERALTQCSTPWQYAERLRRL